jgi:hypothetical protein
MELLIKYLGAGNIYINSKNKVVSLTIYKFSEIISLIIPFCAEQEKNSLFGVKKLDYLDFCKVAKLMSERKHLTIEGVQSQN